MLLSVIAEVTLLPFDEIISMPNCLFLGGTSSLCLTSAHRKHVFSKVNRLERLQNPKCDWPPQKRFSGFQRGASEKCMEDASWKLPKSSGKTLASH